MVLKQGHLRRADRKYLETDIYCVATRPYEERKRCVSYVRRGVAHGGRTLYDMIYLLTAVGQPPGGSSSAHIYTQTVHRTTQNKQYIEQHKNLGRVRAVPHLCGF
jgi:hypothetical protein